MTPDQFFNQNQRVLWVVLFWTLPWKGVALWKSAKNQDKIWFIVLLLINTLAILEILYIFVFSKKKENKAQQKEEKMTLRKKLTVAIPIVFGVLALSVVLIWAYRGGYLFGKADINAGKIKAMRFDPSLYYGQSYAKDASSLVSKVVSDADTYGVNTIFFRAYDPEWGAFYITSYSDTEIEQGYGKENILAKLLSAAHAKNIKVIAWLPVNDYEKPWTNHPDWRAKKKDGTDYIPDPSLHFLCAWHDGFQTWWRGFLEDLLTRYPELDGLEAGEGVIDWNWNFATDYNPVHTQKYLQAYPNGTVGDTNWKIFRAAGMTELHKILAQVAHSKGKKAYLVQNWDPKSDGSLMTSAEMRDSGFDWDGILNLGVSNPNDKIDYVVGEFIWQQWLDYYGTSVFNPEWTAAAANEFVAKVAGRAIPLIHVEITPWPEVNSRIIPTNDQFQTSLQLALNNSQGADFYDHYQAVLKNAMPNVGKVYKEISSDTTPPIISNIQVSDITKSSAVITWTTNEGSTSQVEYGTTTAYGNITSLNSSLVTAHSQSLINLTPSTTYHFRVKSKDGAGNEAISTDQVFTTVQEITDTTLPIISNVQVINITFSSAVILWQTDELSTSQVEYGFNTSYGKTTYLDTYLVTNHMMKLSKLFSNTTYHFRVKSKDEAGNLAVSDDYTFITAKKSRK